MRARARVSVYLSTHHKICDKKKKERGQTKDKTWDIEMKYKEKATER